MFDQFQVSRNIPHFIIIQIKERTLKKRKMYNLLYICTKKKNCVFSKLDMIILQK